MLLEVITMNKDNCFAVYMRDIEETPLLTKEEEIILANRIQNGDNFALNYLITANLKFVVKLAYDFKGKGLPFLDLISAGNIGLMRAAQKFNPNKGAKFSTYSSWWIKQSMRRAIAQDRKSIKVPEAALRKINRIKRSRTDLTRKLGREPTAEEVADSSGLTKRVVNGLSYSDLKEVSLQQPITYGEDDVLECLIPSDESDPCEEIGRKELYDRLRFFLNKLNERERAIIVGRYGLNGERRKTLEEVSESFSLTRERIRQIQHRALKRLKELMTDDLAGNSKPYNENEFVPTDSIAFKKGLREALKSLDNIFLLNKFLSSRTYSVLENNGLIRISELVKQPEYKLRDLKGFGDQSMTEVLTGLTWYCSNMKGSRISYDGDERALDSY